MARGKFLIAILTSVLTLGTLAVPAGAARVTGTRVAVGIAPSAITTNGRYLWVANTISSTISVVDVFRARVLATINTDAPPIAVLADGKKLWVGESDGTVAWYSTKTNRLIDSTTGFTTPIAFLAYGPRLWVADKAASTLTIMNRANGNYVGAFSTGGTGPVALGVAGGNLVVANGASKDLTTVSLKTARVGRQVSLSDHPGGLLVHGGDIWYTLPSQNLVGRADALTLHLSGSYPTAGLTEDGLAASGSRLFVANGASRLVMELRASNGSIIRGHRTGSTPAAMCIAGGRLWVTLLTGRAVQAIPL
ncbi:MAG: hypothetical protein WCL38_07530 [Actinomycetota bacterium]